MKFVFIVHGLKAFKYGETRIKKCFFWLNIINPLILTTIAMFTADLRSRPSLRSCFGDTEEHLQQTNTSSGAGKFLFCNSSTTEDYDVIPFYVIQSFCVFRSVFNWITVSNLPEGFLYYKIFQKMSLFP